MKSDQKLLQEVHQLNKEKAYLKVIELLPIEILEKYNNAELYAEKASAYWGIDQYENCKLMAQQALRIDNKNAKGYNSLGNISAVKKEYAKAENFYLKAIELDTKYSYPYNGLGNVSVAKEEYNKAKEYYLKAIELDPENSYPLNGIGNVYGALKEYEKAKSYYLKAIEVDPKLSNPYSGLGSVYCVLKEYDKAKENYSEAIKLDQNDSWSYRGLGIVYKFLKEYEKAKENYLKAIEIDPKNSHSYNGLGNVYIRLKDYAKAKECLFKAIKIDPKNSHPYNGLGNVYSELSEYAKAKKYYLKTIEVDSQAPHPYNGLGNIYSKLKEYNNANENYLKAIDTDSFFDAPYYNLAQNYFNSDEFKLAKEYYEKFISLKTDKTDKPDFFYKNAIAKIDAINKIIDSSTYKRVSELVQQIKDLLLFKETCVSHYTSISTVQLLVLNESPMRLSEGSFLNDTSEGQELFKFLDFTINKSLGENEEIFTKRPFIGSFIDSAKYNDLTLWRMYGKEALEEAKGCSITINVNELKEAIQAKINPSVTIVPAKGDDKEFYRVAYRNGEIFDFAGANPTQKKKLGLAMKALKDVIQKFKKKTRKGKNEELEMIELLNEIAYLFKSVEYQYENEIRLVITDAIGFEKKIDFNATNFIPSKSPNKVYIDLVPVLPLLKSITIGPKVDKPEEWASTFHYHLLNKGFKPEIHISKLPFK